jgi:hypothetical protein
MEKRIGKEQLNHEFPEGMFLKMPVSAVSRYFLHADRVRRATLKPFFLHDDIKRKAHEVGYLGVHTGKHAGFNGLYVRPACIARIDPEPFFPFEQKNVLFRPIIILTDHASRTIVIPHGTAERAGKLTPAPIPDP